MRLVAYIPATGLGLGARPERADQDHAAIPHHVTVIHSEGLITRAGTEPDPMIVRWVVRKAVRGCAPADLYLGGIVELGGETDTEKAIAARVYGMITRQLRKAIIDGLAGFGIEAPQTFAEYIPHLTLAYLPRGERYTGPTPSGTFTARTVRWCLDDEPFRTVSIGGRDGNPKTELTASLRSWGRRNDLADVPELSPMQEGISLDDGWCIGQPMRIARTGMVFCRDSGEPRLPRPITREDLAEAVEVFAVHRAGLDVDHREGEPQGAVLAMALVDDGEALAILPSYNRRLAAYVAHCSGALWTSPVLVFEPYYHPATGAKVGDFWIRSVAITADPATLHDALDPVSLGATADSAGRWIRGEALAVDPEHTARNANTYETAEADADSETDAGDTEMDEMMKLLEEIKAEQAKQAAELNELREKVMGGASAEGEEMAASDDAEAMAAEGGKADAALTAEVAKLRETLRLTERKNRIEAALSTGRMKPAMRKTWEASIDRDGGETFAAVVESAPAWSAIPQPKGHSVALTVDLAAGGENARHNRAVALQAEAKAKGSTLSYAAALAQAAED